VVSPQRGLIYALFLTPVFKKCPLLPRFEIVPFFNPGFKILAFIIFSQKVVPLVVNPFPQKKSPEILRQV